MNISFLATIFASVVTCDKIGIKKTSDNEAYFAGIKTANLSSAGRVVINWDPAGGEYGDPKSVTYQVFVLKSKETASSPPEAIAQGITFNIDGDLQYEAVLQVTPGLDTFFKGVSPEAYVVGKTSYELKSDLDPNNTYYFWVRAYSPKGKLEASNNQTLLSVTVGIGLPLFEGLKPDNVVVAADYSKISMSWSSATKTKGIVTYQVYDNSLFASPITRLNETLFEYPSPIVGKTYTFGVRAMDDRGEETNRNIVNITVGAPADKIPPEFLGLTSATAVADTKIELRWNASSEEDITYFIYYSHNLRSAIANTPNTYYTVSGLQQNTLYSFVVRAKDRAGNEDQNEIIESATTFNYSVPDFSGIASAEPLPGVSGLTGIKVKWNAAFGSLTGYRIFMSESENGEDFSSPVSVQDAIINNSAAGPYLSSTKTEATIKNLKEGTTYSFVVRAFYQEPGSSTIKSDLNSLEKSATTLTRKVPTFAGVKSVTKLGSDGGLAQVQVAWDNPESDGLYDKFLVEYEEGSCSSGFSSPTSLTETTTSARSYTVSNLAMNKTFRFRVRIGFSPFNLIGDTSACQEVTTSIVPPVFSGVEEIESYGDVRDLTEMHIIWGDVIGDCTAIEVSVRESPLSPNFAAPTETLDCDARDISITSLTPDKTYYVQVRARYTTGGTNYTDGEGQELFHRTMLPTPVGDGMQSATVTNVSGNPAIDLSWALPDASEGWNIIYIWKATGTTESTAKNAVKAAAARKGDGTGPISEPYQMVSKAVTWTDTLTTYQDVSVTPGIYSCYLVKAVYLYSGGGINYYAASSNTNVSCGKPAFTPPSFSGVKSGVVDGTFADGTARIKLEFVSAPVGDINEYWVFYSAANTLSSFGDLTKGPWQKIIKGDSVYDENGGDKYIYVGGKGHTIGGAGYYLVRYHLENGPPGSEDTNTAISTAVNVSYALSNYVAVPKSVSGLSYDYYLMTFEASAKTGTSLGTVNLTSSDLYLKTCETTFHEDGTMWDISCGTNEQTLIAESVKNATPLSNVTFAQSYAGCRASSIEGMMMRLPTEEEWRRASKWPSANYDSMWDTYSTDAIGCNVSGATENTGSHTYCTSYVGAYDMAGNVSEWVDARMRDEAVSARFGYAPTIGVLIENGIDNVTRRFHTITPGPGKLALLMGSTNSGSFTYQRPYDVETERWVAPGTNDSTTGFRCVGLLKATMPSMAELALPKEPIYTENDLPADPANWKIPENLYIGDTKLEDISILSSPFPIGPNLSAWNFNSATDPGATVTDLYGGRNLTLIGIEHLASGSDLFGNTVYNVWQPSPTYGPKYRITNALYNMDGIFTIGGWFYRSDWAIGGNNLLVGIGDGTAATGLNFSSGGLGWSRPPGYTSILGYNVSGLSSGWHHITIVRYGSSDHRLYIDGQQVAFSTDTHSSLASNTTLGIGTPNFGSAYQWQGRIAAFFVHIGSRYTSDEIKRVMNTKYFPAAFPNIYDGVKISWVPWSKKVCNPTCESVNESQFKYHIYRMIEPPKIDIRPATPWAVTGGTDYISSIPLDPLAVDALSIPLYTPITTIDGVDCNNESLTGCTFTDQLGLDPDTGWDPKKMYIYIMVVEDGDGNKQIAKIQRYRSPYFTAGIHQGGTSSFRTELRFRRAAAFLVDEAYQQTQAIPQIMIHVPMNMSGLDHDFYIQKYEGSSYSGSPDNTTNVTPILDHANLPLAADNSGNWMSNAARCNDFFLRNLSMNDSSCKTSEATPVTNGTSTIIQSKQGVAPLISITQGAYYKACRDSYFIDKDGNYYYLELPSSGEWNKAADWGDVDQDGDIDQHFIKESLPTLVVADIEYKAARVAGGCNSDNQGTPLNTNSATTINCRSRYGVADMQGNVREWIMERAYNFSTVGAGFDNGMDGLMLAPLMRISSGTPGQFDLLRGYAPVSGSNISGNNDSCGIADGLVGIERGGHYNDQSGAGRWHFVSYSPSISSVSYVIGGRCVR